MQRKHYVKPLRACGRMEGVRILVTGGAGFIGSHLVDRLATRNEVTVIDDLSTGTLRNLGRARGKVHVKKASVLETDTLATAMKGQQVVYHLAAKTSVPESVAKPEEYWRTNVQGTVGVLKAAADAAVRRVVFVSSAAVYGNSPEMPKVESMRPDPASPYAVTKMVGEFGCEEIRGMTGIETVVVRLLSEIVDRPIRVVRKPERPGDIRHSHADVSKAKEKLGFAARTSVREGLEKTLEHARKRSTRSS